MDSYKLLRLLETNGESKRLRETFKVRWELMRLMTLIESNGDLGRLLGTERLRENNRVNWGLMSVRYNTGE